mmetsp:Transcript_17150/g.27200  ORF Transcript_17150/g.27200 Transcript_17150/m.27200 type:complete len:90 (+) Transcript_17150:116-385(+)
MTSEIANLSLPPSSYECELTACSIIDLSLVLLIAWHLGRAPPSFENFEWRALAYILGRWRVHRNALLDRPQMQRIRPLTCGCLVLGRFA